ncbi:MAG: LTA synthase family protein [Candidatus Limimorpha sp.]
MVSKKEVSLWKMLAIRLCTMLLLLALSRWLLFLFNSGTFPNVGIKEQFRLFFIGIRFDIWTLVIFNLPLIIFYTIPIKIKYSAIYGKIVDTIFVISNSIAILLNIIDVIYFRFIDKRMTTELFDFLKWRDDNQAGLLASFIVDFWYMGVVFLVFLALIIVITRKTKLRRENDYGGRWYLRHSIAFVLMIFASSIGIRGGFQLKPIRIMTAAQYTETRNMPLILNTPFTIGRGGSKATLKKVTFFEDSVIDSLYTPVKGAQTANRFVLGEANNYNVMIVILESLGQEMIKYYNYRMGESLTPFLDSIFAESLTFDGMANGRKSIEAVPSILSGIPSLMANDYVSSAYAANHIEGLGTVLKENGYSTAFFHGGNNGTMSFDATSSSAGFDEYFGRDEYGNDKDYDGTWGIPDMPFLQFTAKRINEMSKPFATAIFTLSSHHPYTIPQGYTVPEGAYKSEFEKTVRYADDSMRKFFETISKYSWYDSTIFVFTADHVCPEHNFEDYLCDYGQHRVPIAFYAPSVFERNKTKITAQQTDIGVSIVAALGLSDSIFSFGRNVFDSTQKTCFTSYNNNIYQYYDGEYFLHNNGVETTEVFYLRNDSTLKNNIVKGSDIKWKETENEFRLRLQQYNNRMINNKLYR